MKVNIQDFYKKLRGDWLGDWDNYKDIMVLDCLELEDKLCVVVHEFVEMMVSKYWQIPDCCNPNYKDEEHGQKNLQAHNIATKAERAVVNGLGMNWKTYSTRLRKLRYDIYGKVELSCDSCYKRKKCKNKNK